MTGQTVRLRKNLLLVMYLVPALAGMFVNYIELLAIAVFLYMTYLMWKSIEGPRARMTPGKSVGFQFIPAYGLYWMFQVYPGFATDFSKHAKNVGESVGVPAPRLSRGLMLAHVLLFMLTASMTRMASEPTYRLSNDMGVTAVLISVWLAAIIVDAIVIGKVCDAVNWLADATSATLPASPTTAPSDSPVRHTRLGITSSILALLMLVAFVMMLASRDAASGAGVDLSWSSLPTLNGASTLLTILLGVAATALAIAAFGRRNTRKVFAVVGLGGALVLLTITAALMVSSDGGFANSGAAYPRLQKSRDYPCLFPIDENGKWGFIDATGRVVIAPQFDYARPFAEGLAVVNVGGICARGDVQGGKWGFVDSSGAYAINPQYINARDFSEGLARVSAGEIGDAVGFIDTLGHIAFELVQNPLFADIDDELDQDGTRIRHVRGDQLEDKFLEGMVSFSSQDKHGFLDRAGRIVITPRFDDARGFTEGLAPAQDGSSPKGRWGYINTRGRWFIRPQFDYAGPFSEGLAAVEVGATNSGTAYERAGKWGYIDRRGKLVINPQFDHDVEPFITDYFRDVLGGDRPFNREAEDALFKETFALIYQALGEDAWKHCRDGAHSGPLSVYVFETLATGVAHNIERWRNSSTEDLKRRLIEFKQDVRFTENTGAGANTKAKLQRRVAFAMEYLG